MSCSIGQRLLVVLSKYTRDKALSGHKNMRFIKELYKNKSFLRQRLLVLHLELILYLENVNKAIKK